MGGGGYCKFGILAVKGWVGYWTRQVRIVSMSESFRGLWDEDDEQV